MPHDTKRSDDMSVPNGSSARSFTNGSTYSALDSKSNGHITSTSFGSRPSTSTTNGAGSATSDQKSSGNRLGPGFGTTSTLWGSNIWSQVETHAPPSDLSWRSTAATRDNSASREGARQDSTNGPGVIERQSGAKPSTESATKDLWGVKNTSLAHRGLPTGRSVSSTTSTELPPVSQHRSASNNTLPSPYSPYPPDWTFPAWPRSAVSQGNAHTPYARSAFSSPYTQAPVSKGPEQPPTVYTKFDRPTDPNARIVDPGLVSAISDVSPTETRSSAFLSRSSYRNPDSRDPSRDSSNLPSGFGTPSFTVPDYRSTSSRPTQANSRAPSMSSPWNDNDDYDACEADLNAVAAQLRQMGVYTTNSRPTSSRAPSSSHGSRPSQGTYLPYGNLSGRPIANGLAGASDTAENADDVFRHSFQQSFAIPGADSSPQFRNTSASNSVASFPRGTVPHTPNAPVFTPGQPYAGASTFSNLENLLRSSSYGLNSTGLPQHGNRTSALAEQPLMIDPRTNQVVSVPCPSYGLFSPYGLLPPQSQIGNGVYNGMQIPGDHLTPSHGEPNMISVLMYEFRNNPKGKRYELKDIYDHVAEFSGDQHGSRFIQTKLETANSDEKERIFSELMLNSITLMKDVFGNYVIQKFFEHGDQVQKKRLAAEMKGHVRDLSGSMYGCRVVQKALDVVLCDQQAEIVRELRGHVMACVKDQNGNHVIQKAIERCRPEHIDFIFAAFQGEVRSLSTHAYGCRVIQRCLERCDDHYKHAIMMELIDGIESMVMDSFGNYVVQHIVEHDRGEGRHRVLDMVAKNLETYSKHKFASNVVEKCLIYADEGWKRNLWLSIVRAPTRSPGVEGDGLFVGLIRDQYGNYVIQKLLDTLSADDYYQFIDYLHPALMNAKRTGGSSCTKQVQVIEKKLLDRSKINDEAQHPMKRNIANGIYNPNAFRAPIGTPQWRNNHSTNHTPSPPSPGPSRPGLQNGMPPSTFHSNGNTHPNGDAAEGASAYTNGPRRVTSHSLEEYTRQ